MDDVDTRRISPRLRNALIADQLDAATTDEGDQLLLARTGDPVEWTAHLSRQLGFTRTDPLAGLHETLLTLIPELERLLREWPLPIGGPAAAALAGAATKSLSPLETYATLLCGPPEWRRTSISSTCTIGKLDRRLRAALERGLAASLNGLFSRWSAWQIPRLRDRWQEAKARELQRVAEVEESESKRQAAERRRERLSSKADREKWLRAASYQAPGRTT